MFKAVLIAGSILAFGMGAAVAQQPVQGQQGAQAGTCSGREAMCERYCETNYSNRLNQCRGTCNNKLATCMQTGIWHVDNGPDLPVQRQ